MKPLEIYFSAAIFVFFLFPFIFAIFQNASNNDEILLFFALPGVALGTTFRTFSLMILDEISILLMLLSCPSPLKFPIPKLLIIPLTLAVGNILLSSIILDFRAIRFLLVPLSIIALFKVGMSYRQKSYKLFSYLWLASAISILLYSFAGFLATILNGDPLAHFLLSGSGVDYAGEPYIAITQGSSYVAIVYLSLLASDLQLRICSNSIGWKTPASVLLVALVSYQYDSRSGYFIILFYILAQLLLLLLRPRVKVSFDIRLLFLALFVLMCLAAILGYQDISEFIQTQIVDSIIQGPDSRDSNRALHFLAYLNHFSSHPLQSLVGSGIYSHKVILADSLDLSALSHLDKSHYLPGMRLDNNPTIVRTNFILAGLIDLGILFSLSTFLSVAYSCVINARFVLASKSVYLLFILPSLLLVSLSSNISDALLAFLLLMLPFLPIRRHRCLADPANTLSARSI